MLLSTSPILVSILLTLNVYSIYTLPDEQRALII